MPNVLVLGGTEDNDVVQVCARAGTSPIQHMVHHSWNLAGTPTGQTAYLYTGSYTLTLTPASSLYTGPR